MITHEVKLMVLYEIERRIMDETTPGDRKYDSGWKVVQEMLEEEFKARDAYQRTVERTVR